MERKKYKRSKLTYEERLTIEAMLNRGHSYAEIGRELNRNRATIQKEVSMRPKPYNAQDAQNGIKI